MSTCWICGSSSRVLHKRGNVSDDITAADLSITDSRYGLTFELWRCTECGFIYTPRESLPSLPDLYAEVDDPVYEKTDEGRTRQMNWLLGQFIQWQPRARSLLDVGAATGMLARSAAARGLEAIGIEPSASLAGKGAASGAPILHGTLPHPDLDGRRFDIVSLVDVIEHVSDPLALLKAAAEHVRSEGCVIVVTPDVSSVAARLLGQRWWHYRIAHVCYFNRRSMALAAKKAGLQWTDSVRARWFFPARYLVDRVGTYAKVSDASRLIARLPGTQWALDAMIPLNLFDSDVHLLRPANAIRKST